MPALWLAAEAPTVVVLDAAPTGFDAAPAINFAEWPLILNDRTLSSGRHIVLGDVDGAHRIWLRNVAAGQVLAYVIVRDSKLAIRLAALQRFDRRLAGDPPMRTPPGIRPSPFQHRRLSMLLDILDAFQSRPRAPPTAHEIAERFVYRGMSIRRGTDWKNSTQRRQTKRLIDEAFALMSGGYRTLLGS